MINICDVPFNDHMLMSNPAQLKRLKKWSSPNANVGNVCYVHINTNKHASHADALHSGETANKCWLEKFGRENSSTR